MLTTFRCEACKQIIEGILIKHHTCYKKNITMVVCESCHAKIHRSIEWCEYTPIDYPGDEKKTEYNALRMIKAFNPKYQEKQTLEVASLKNNIN